MKKNLVGLIVFVLALVPFVGQGATDSYSAFRFQQSGGAGVTNLVFKTLSNTSYERRVPSTEGSITNFYLYADDPTTNVQMQSLLGITNLPLALTNHSANVSVIYYGTNAFVPTVDSSRLISTLSLTYYLVNAKGGTNLVSFVKDNATLAEYPITNAISAGNITVSVTARGSSVGRINVWGPPSLGKRGIVDVGATTSVIGTVTTNRGVWTISGVSKDTVSPLTSTGIQYGVVTSAADGTQTNVFTAAYSVAPKVVVSQTGADTTISNILTITTTQFIVNFGKPSQAATWISVGPP